MYGYQSFYSVFFFVLLFLSWFLSIIFHERKDRAQIVYSLDFLILFFLSAFRATTVGGDLENYIPNFHLACEASSLKELFESSGYEPLYMLLQKLIGIISPTDRFFLFITSIISLSGPFFLFRKYSPLPILSLFLYYLLGYYSNTFNNVRQSMALSLCFFSIPFILERDIKKFLLLVFAALNIHFSSAIFLFVYPLARIKMEPINVFSIVVAGAAIYIASSISIVSYVIDNFFMKYSDAILIITDSGQGLLLVYIFMAILVYTFFYLKRGQIPPMYQNIVNLLVLLLVLTPLAQSYASIIKSLARLTQYLFIPVVILIPILLMTINKRARYLVVFILCTVCYYYLCNFICSYSVFTMSNSQGTIPYVWGF